MAALTAANVAVTRSWEAVDRAGCVKEKVSDLVLTLSSQGGLTNAINAATLGFSRMNSVTFTNFYISGSTNSGITVGITTDGLKLFTCDSVSATAANHMTIADVSGVLYVRVTGNP